MSSSGRELLEHAAQAPVHAVSERVVDALGVENAAVAQHETLLRGVERDVRVAGDGL